MSVAISSITYWGDWPNSHDATFDVRATSNRTWVSAEGELVPAGQSRVVGTGTITALRPLIPSITLPSTTAGIDDQTSRFTVTLHRPGSRQVVYTVLDDFTLPVSFDPSTTWAAVKINKNGKQPLRDTSTYTKTETDYQISLAVGTLNDASDVVKGRTRLSVAPASASAPISVGDNDPRIGSYINILSQGAVGDGSTSNTVALSSAIIAAAALGAGLYIPVGSFKTNSVTLSVPILCAPGASMLKPTTGQTVTITNAFQADTSKHFDNATAGQGTVSFAGNTVLDKVYPQWWGAYSDNTHDTATSAAINAMFLSGATRFYFPSGTYLNSAPVLIKSSCTVYGDGPSSIIYNPNLTNTGIESISSGVVGVVDTSNVIIEKLYIKGGYSSGTGSNTHGIFINSGSSHVTVTNCTISNTSYSGINAFGDYSFITNNFIDSCAIDGVEVAKSYVNVIGNTITNTGLDATNGVAGIEVVAGADPIQKINVIGNIIKTAKTGISIGGASLISVINVNANIISDYSVYGINAGNVGGVSFANLSVNTIKDSTGVPPVGQGMILANVTDFTATGNIIDVNMSAGVDIQGVSARGIVSNNKFSNCLFGIAYTGTGGQLRIEGNDAQTATTPLQVTGTMTNVFIQNNSGWNPRGPLAFAGGDPAIPASTVTLQNLFGYPCFVTIKGGTVSAISLGSPAGDYIDQGISLTAGQTATVIVPATGFITLTYTVAPTWHWMGL